MSLRSPLETDEAGLSQLVRFLPPAAIGALVFGVAYANGGYGLSTRTVLAVVLWWSIMIGVGFGLFPWTALSREAVIIGALFAAFGGWTLASIVWAADAESAFNEFNRVSLYLAVLGLAVVGASRGHAGRWSDGLCAGILATAVLALSSRLFPDLVASRAIGAFIPSAASRLSFPVGYWNALGMLTSLALPLCFRSAMVAGRRHVRALVVSLVPVLAAVLYLTSSRGAVIMALGGTAIFLIATERRWSALGVVAAAGFGSALAVAVLLQRSTLVNGPLGSELAASQGRAALLLIFGCCLLAGAVFLGGDSFLRERFRPSRLAGRLLVVALLALVLVGTVLAHPVERLQAFKQPLSAGPVSTSDFAISHLLSEGGSGRWQFWSAAVDQFRSAPLHGGGAGSYESWWAEHGSFAYFLKNAHSLYLEVLGELGIIGLLLIGATFVGGLVVGVRRLREERGDRRVTLAALIAVLMAFIIGAGIDWIWQVTVVGVVGISALGLIAGSRRLEPARHPRNDSGRPVQRSRIAFGVVTLAMAWVLICVQAIPWLAAAKISDSQAAVRRGDTEAALKAALDAKSLQPWAGSPYLQIALVAEEQGDLVRARHWIASALRRDSRDWRVWFVASRIQRESGLLGAAARSYARAKALNPRSRLFSERAEG